MLKIIFQSENIRKSSNIQLLYQIDRAKLTGSVIITVNSDAKTSSILLQLDFKSVNINLFNLNMNGNSSNLI